MIVALVLAAGESRRMGRPKQLLLFGRETVIAAAVRPYLAAGAVDRVIVVGGARAALVALAVPRHPKLTVVRNARWRLGMSSSIRCGMRAVPAATGAVLLSLGDQPRIPSRVVGSVIAAWRDARPRPLVVIPVCGGRRGHPALFDRAVLPRLLRLRGDEGARGVVRALGTKVRLLPVRSPGIHEDLDTPAEYEALRARTRRTR